MEPTLVPPACSGCGTPARLSPKVTRFRRGERVLPFDGYIWECHGGCIDPAGSATPYRFSSLELMEWEDAAVAEKWLAHFGKAMPPSQRGRVPEAQRTVRVPVLLTPAEAERLDALRGDRPRGDFLRQLLRAPERRAG